MTPVDACDKFTGALYGLVKQQEIYTICIVLLLCLWSIRHQSHVMYMRIAIEEWKIVDMDVASIVLS